MSSIKLEICKICRHIPNEKFRMTRYKVQRHIQPMHVVGELFLAYDYAPYSIDINWRCNHQAPMYEWSS